MVIFLLPEIQKRKVNGLNYKFSFVPEYTARSYNLEPNGSDTLHHIAINGSVINYDAGVQKIFTLIRATLKFGPLFFQNSSYNYHLIEYENVNYVFSFSNKKRCISLQYTYFL